MIYGWIGKTVVRYSLRYARQRYRRPAAIAAAGVLLAAAGAAAYWLRREVPEG
jgi:hypothetical protein